MLSREEVQEVVRRLGRDMQTLFPRQRIETILYGSYARGEEEFGSDIDVLVLVEASRDIITERNWAIGDLAANYLLEYGILVSPVVENRAYYHANEEALPFYRNIKHEGVSICA